MANRRMISAGIFEDEFTGQLNYFERLLWIGLFASIADDQGRMYDSTALIRARVFLYDDVKDEQVEEALNKLASANKIIRYEKEGKGIIQIVKWWIYQTPSWASASKYPPPDNWTDRTKYHAKGNKIISKDWDKEGGIHSRLHSIESTGIDSAINDVKGDVKGDVDDESSAQSFYSKFQGTVKFPLMGTKDTQYLGELLKEHGEKLILEIAEWCNTKRDFKSMFQILRAIDSAAPGWNTKPKGKLTVMMDTLEGMKDE